MDKTKGSVKEKSSALDQNIDRFRQQPREPEDVYYGRLVNAFINRRI